MDKLIININDYKSINRANIEINKINVVSGVNGSGKSTLSRILYSFLKGNSIKRKYYLFERIVDEFNGVMDDLCNEKYVDYDFPDSFKVTDTIEEVIEKYNSLYEIMEKHVELSETKVEELDKKISIEFDMGVKKLKNEGIISNDVEFQSNDNIDSKISELIELLPKEDEKSKDFLKNLLNLFFEKSFFLGADANLFRLTYFADLLEKFTGEDSYKVSKECVQSLLIKEEGDLIGKKTLNFEIELSNHSKSNPYGYFFNKGFIKNIYYFDNVSVFDLYLALDRKYGLKNVILRHTGEFVGELFENNDDEVHDESISYILEKIENIIGGQYGTFLLPMFHADKIDNISLGIGGREKKVVTKSDTPSGIKQMGIIQLLLLNNKLKKGDYLIIDEPEVNLHPDWQFKFAEILVLLAKLDITIYINSHSPLLIESISAFSEFYDMQEDVNYYLTEPSESEGKYDFVKIKSDEIVRVYDNLGNAYDSIDQLRLKKRFGE